MLLKSHFLLFNALVSRSAQIKLTGSNCHWSLVKRSLVRGLTVFTLINISGFISTHLLASSVYLKSPNTLSIV
jgi:hypothetical protein